MGVWEGARWAGLKPMPGWPKAVTEIRDRDSCSLIAGPGVAEDQIGDHRSSHE